MSAKRQVIAPKLAGATDLHRRQVDTRHGIPLGEAPRDRNAAAAAKVEDRRSGFDAPLQEIEPLRVQAIVRVVASIDLGDEVVSAPHDRLRILHRVG